MKPLLGLAIQAREWASWVFPDWHEDPALRQAIFHHLHLYSHQLRELEQAINQGARRRRVTQNVLLGSLSARVCCLIHAAMKRGQKLHSVQFWGIVNELRPWTDTDEVVELKLVPKSGGGHRMTFKFGLRRAALSYLSLDILKFVWGTPPEEFNWRGRGPHRAVQALRHSILSARPWVAVADIKSCFPSFRHEGIQEYVPLPSVVIRNVILLPENVVILDSHGIQVSGSDRDTLRQGLPAGAPASGFIASHLLSSALAPFGGDDPVFRYSDNLACALPTQADAVATLTSLQAHLIGHPVGELTLHHTAVAHTDQGVSFLGYRVVTDPHGGDYSSWAFPDRASFGRHWLKLREKAEKVPPHLREDFAIERTLAWIASWRDWDPTEERIDHVLGQALAL